MKAEWESAGELPASDAAGWAAREGQRARTRSRSSARPTGATARSNRFLARVLGVLLNNFDVAKEYGVYVGGGDRGLALEDSQHLRSPVLGVHHCTHRLIPVRGLRAAPQGAWEPDPGPTRRGPPIPEQDHGK